MKINMNDPFSAAIAGARRDLEAKLAQKTQQNARLLQSTVVKGIRTNELASNSIQSWKPLSPGYAVWKAAQGGSRQMLIGPNRAQTESSPSHSGGELMRSIEVTRETKFRHHVGTNVPYARAHEFGYAPRNLPARPYIRPGIENAGPEMEENWREAVREVWPK